MTSAAAPVRTETGVKETVESILIAFVLAFIFRCFVVEAFVIPTGSMAPTLMGAHLQFRCPDCGYDFAAGFPDRLDNFSVPEVARKTYGVICPNCGMRLPKSLPNDAENDAEQPTIRYGDRILVMKYLYLLHPPQRWDVVVFKTPDNPDNPEDYSVNYIKRLIGRPGERLFVAEGDLYVSPDTGQAPKETDFVVQTKTRVAQDALWRIVYDADYVPVGLPRAYTSSRGIEFTETPWRQPWHAGDGWTTNDPPKGVSARQFAFDGPAASGTLNFDPTAVPNTGPFTDWLAYDQTGDQVLGEPNSLDRESYAVRPGIVRPVGDLKLSTVVDRFTGDGTLRLVVGKRGDAEFAAEVTGDTVRLVKIINGHPREIGVARRPNGRFRLAIQNVDYRVAVSIDGVEKIVTTPEDYKPDVVAVVRRAKEQNAGPAGYCRIDAEHCTAALSHLQLWRDVYYRDTDPRNLIQRGVSQDFPEHVVTLKADEYFAMGDNSYQSSDGRYWTAPVDLPDEGIKADAGIVPGRFLLGKAFFVYWPAGYRAVPGFPPLVPNFGEMRFIR